MINLEYDKSKDKTPYYLELVGMNWDNPIRSSRIGYLCDKLHLKQQLKRLMNEFTKAEILELAECSYKRKFKKGDAVLARNDSSQIWTYNVYDDYESKYEKPHNCKSGWYKYCIPYKGNEERLGKC